MRNKPQDIESKHKTSYIKDFLSFARILLLYFSLFFSVCLFFPSREFLCTVILCRKSVCGKIRLFKVKAILLQRKEINSFFLALTLLNDAFTILTVIADSFVIRRYSDDKVVSFIEIKKYI